MGSKAQATHPGVGFPRKMETRQVYTLKPGESWGKASGNSKQLQSPQAVCWPPCGLLDRPVTQTFLFTLEINVPLEPQQKGRHPASPKGTLPSAHLGCVPHLHKRGWGQRASAVTGHMAQGVEGIDASQLL